VAQRRRIEDRHGRWLHNQWMSNRWLHSAMTVRSMPSSRLLLQLKPLNQRVRHPQRHPQRRQHRPIPRNTSRLRFPTSAHLETASPSTIIGNGNTSSAACADGG